MRFSGDSKMGTELGRNVKRSRLQEPREVNALLNRATRGGGMRWLLGEGKRTPGEKGYEIWRENLRFQYCESVRRLEWFRERG